MFDRLEDLLVRFEEVLNLLSDPAVIGDPERFQKLMKEQSDLQPIAEAYREYKKNQETIEDSVSMLEEESDMVSMLEEGLLRLSSSLRRGSIVSMLRFSHPFFIFTFARARLLCSARVICTRLQSPFSQQT